MRKKKLLSKVPFKKNKVQNKDENLLKPSLYPPQLDPMQVCADLSEKIGALKNTDGSDVTVRLVVMHSDANDLLTQMHGALKQRVNSNLLSCSIHWVRKAHRLQPTPILAPLIKRTTSEVGHVQTQCFEHAHTLVLMFSDRFDYIRFLTLHANHREMFDNAQRIVIFAPFISTCLRTLMLKRHPMIKKEQHKYIFPKLKFAYLTDSKSSKEQIETALDAFKPTAVLDIPRVLKEFDENFLATP